MIIRFVTVLAYKRETEFMQACDVFEKWKIVGNVEIIKLTYREGVQIDFERGQKELDRLVEVLKTG